MEKSRHETLFELEGHVKELCKRITKIDKDGALTGENFSHLVNVVTKQVRIENDLKWNHKVQIEFFWDNEDIPVGEIFDLMITWTPEGQGRAKEIHIPIQNFYYGKAH
tara:strand:- start:122 stop:445 length:324 start_codon:yes stop_codon:yes gene_type:complete